MQISKVKLGFAAVAISSALLLSCQPQAVAPAAQAPAQTPVVVELPSGVSKDQLRQLTGKITVAVEGVLPVPGMPLTKRQEAWQTLLAQYKQLQPNVEVTLEGLPEGQSGEVWCEARRVAQNMPDISMVGECNYFAPTEAEIQSSAVIATDFKPYEDEVNPYSGSPWRDDWMNDFVRLGRCQAFGALDMWTCQTVEYGQAAIFVNEDILKEFGYGPGEFPKTHTELWELSRKINEDGRYIAWDEASNNGGEYLKSIASNLVVPELEAAGWKCCDMRTVSLVFADLNYAKEFCNKDWWSSESPRLQEALQQTKLYIDAAGGLSYFDPARDLTGTEWLAGRAAMRFDSSGFFGRIAQAQTDGTLFVKSYRLQSWPKFTQDDLINKDLEIYFDGVRYMRGGGSGDVFAPIPAVRASGEDKNVDLMVRDFLQFLSSPVGQQRILAEGGIPVNPVAVKQLAPEKQVVFDLLAPVYQGAAQPPGNFTWKPHYSADSEFSWMAFLRGELDLKTATLKSDENTTRELVKRIVDEIDRFGAENFPPECEAWR
ncbi:MAG: carbohydrate ABC transporter substrate-binding protein [Caldilineaceae bacterium]|nr:carbohydrate ABC transporter substrate-binding protein [Caldilineaceae bacterium]